MPDVRLLSIGLGPIAFYAGEPPGSEARLRAWKARKEEKVSEMDARMVSEAYLVEQLQYGGDVIAMRDAEIVRLKRQLDQVKVELEDCKQVIERMAKDDD